MCGVGCRVLGLIRVRIFGPETQALSSRFCRRELQNDTRKPDPTHHKCRNPAL